MSKTLNDKGKQMRLDNFFKKGNQNNESKINDTKLKNSEDTHKYARIISIENSSDDDKTPKKPKPLGNFNELKENLQNLTEEMDTNKGSASKFKFRTKLQKPESTVSEKTSVNTISSGDVPQKNSVLNKPSHQTTTQPKLIKKNPFSFNDDDDDDFKVLPLSQKENDQEIRPKSKFLIKSKASPIVSKINNHSSSVISSKFNPTSSSTQSIEQTLQAEREKKITILSSTHHVERIRPDTNPNKSLEFINDIDIDSLDKSAAQKELSKFRFKKSSNSTNSSQGSSTSDTSQNILNPKKSLDSIITITSQNSEKLSQNLLKPNNSSESFLCKSNSLIDITSSPVSLKATRSSDSLINSTNGLALKQKSIAERKTSSTNINRVKISSPPKSRVSSNSKKISICQSSSNETITDSKLQKNGISNEIKVNVNDEEISEDCDNLLMEELDSFSAERLKDNKLKFYEHYFNVHSQIPLSHYANIEGYSVNTVLKVKRAIQSIGIRLKRLNEKAHQKAKPLPQKRLSRPLPPESDDDEHFNINEIMDNVEEENRKSAGKSYESYANVGSTTTTSFKPRINMKNSLPDTTQASTSSLSNEYSFTQNELDSLPIGDDGFPVIDYTRLDSPVKSALPPLPRQTQPVEKKKKETLDSMIPDPDTNFKCKNSSALGNFHSSVKNDGITGEFDGSHYHFSNDLKRAFQNTFGLRAFRQNQLQAINAALLGNDCFILMPTGGGKSLCYQLPAILSKGVTIVISPLKSLILDQVNKLNSLDIKAAALSGEISQADSRIIYSDINSSNPTIKLLYVTPEKISASTFFQDTLTSMHDRGNFARVVIDEAHCVSTWGHDFRPDYKKLGELRKRFPAVPLMALTATANPRVRTDVVHQLGIYNCKWFLSSFNRPNLKYIVTQKSGAKTLNDIISLIKTKYPRASGIIYCLSRKDCDNTAQKLQLANIKATSYHAGMTDKNREKAQTDWITDKFRVVCATIAFGMGIDKPDVRYVIHYSLPKSIEGYYQESGRAGRDGNLATCILYYNYGDKIRYMKMIQSEPANLRQVSVNNLDLVVNFCENMVDCRRAVQLNYFGEHFTKEQCLENKISACDNCSRSSQYKNIDATDISKTLVSAIQELCERNRFTVLQMVDVFKGSETKKVIDSGHNHTRYHGCLKTWDRSDIQRLLHKLIIENYLREEIHVMHDIPLSYVKLGKNVSDLMMRQQKINFAILEKHQVASKKVVVASSDNQLYQKHKDKLDELQDRCYHDLMEVARAIAEEKNLTIQQIMNMEAIRQMSILMPETEEEMLKIPHVTKANFMKYGEKFLASTIPYSAQRSFYEMDRMAQEEQNSQEFGDNDSEGNNLNWDEIGREAAQSSAKKSFKRKSSDHWGKSVSKKYKYTRGKKKSPAKRKSQASSSASKAPRGKGRKFTGKGLMPLPSVSF